MIESTEKPDPCQFFDLVWQYAQTGFTSENEGLIIGIPSPNPRCTKSMVHSWKKQNQEKNKRNVDVHFLPIVLAVL